MKAFFIIMAIAGTLFTVGYLLRKKLQVSTSHKMNKRAKRFEYIGVAILFIGYLAIGFKFVMGDGNRNVALFIFPFLSLVSFFRAVMQWKYNREAKLWAVELYEAVTFIILFIVMLRVAGLLFR